MLLLCAHDVRDVIAKVGVNNFMDLLIAKTEESFLALSSDKIEIPVRHGFAGQGLVEWMPVHFKKDSVVIKVVSYFPDNPHLKNASTIQAAISRYSGQDGRMTEVVEGGLLTAMRTGAASAVASRVLARPDSAVLGLVGCGAQSVTQAHALARCFPIRDILAYDICPTAHRSIVERLAFLGITVRPASLQDVEAEADILCTATSAEIGGGPVIVGRNLKPHVHINAIGSDYPGKTEVPKPVLSQALVVPDHREQALREGECQQLRPEDIGPDLCELVGNPGAFLGWRDRVSVFDSTGVSLEDAVALDTIGALARELGIGTHVNFTLDVEDPKNPYEPLGPPWLSNAFARRFGDSTGSSLPSDATVLTTQ